MRLRGLHVLLTYRCNYECDHCFVWGSPRQRGTMTLTRLLDLLGQAREPGTVEWIYFEGGEPFLFYPVLLRGVRRARALGFRVGIVTNAYWATDPADAREWLAPLAGQVEDLSVSSDLYHGDERPSPQARWARRAARELGIPVTLLSIDQPGEGEAPEPEGVAVRFRGRAAEVLADQARGRPPRRFTACRDENLREPGRLHVDPFGYLHVCQGVALGNVFRDSLRKLCESYDPLTHPIVAPLLDGGPVELARRYGVPTRAAYADGCHLCYETRLALRGRFPDALTPDAMYGLPGEEGAGPRDETY